MSKKRRRRPSSRPNAPRSSKTPDDWPEASQHTLTQEGVARVKSRLQDLGQRCDSSPPRSILSGLPSLLIHPAPPPPSSGPSGGNLHSWRVGRQGDRRWWMSGFMPAGGRRHQKDSGAQREGFLLLWCSRTAGTGSAVAFPR